MTQPTAVHAGKGVGRSDGGGDRGDGADDSDGDGDDGGRGLFRAEVVHLVSLMHACALLAMRGEDPAGIEYSAAGAGVAGSPGHPPGPLLVALREERAVAAATPGGVGAGGGAVARKPPRPSLSGFPRRGARSEGWDWWMRVGDGDGGSGGCGGGRSLAVIGGVSAGEAAALAAAPDPTYLAMQWVVDALVSSRIPLLMA